MKGATQAELPLIFFYTSAMVLLLLIAEKPVTEEE
jgi:hypothetical protein